MLSKRKQKLTIDHIMSKCKKCILKNKKEENVKQREKEMKESQQKKNTKTSWMNYK